MTTLPGPTRKESLPRKPRAVWGENGAAAIEFALVLPILVLLVCGIIEFGLMFYNKQMITNASREGARAGIVDQVSDAQIQTIVINYLRETLPSGPSKIISLMGRISTTLINVSVRRETDDLVVAVGFNYPLLLGGIVGRETVAVSAQTTMRMEPK